MKYKRTLAVVFLSIFFSGINLYAEEMLVNPGFEDGMKAWGISKPYPGIFEIREGEAFEGNNYLYLENNKPGRPEYFQQNKTYKVKKDETFIIKCQAKGKGELTFALALFGKPLGKLKFLRTTRSLDYELTGEWKEYVWEYTVPSDQIVLVRFSFLLRNFKYYAHIDGCSIGKTNGGSGVLLKCVKATASDILKERYAAKHAIDDNPDAGWVAEKWQSWLKVELDKVYTINHTYWERTKKTIVERSLRDYDVEVSLDGENYTKVKEVRNHAGLFKHDYFPPVKAKYVRLKIINPHQSPASIGEFKVWEGNAIIEEKTQAAKQEKSDIQIVKFRSKKILYDFNEKGYADITLENTTDKRRDISVTVTEQWGTGPKRSILNEKLSMEPGGQNALKIDLPVGSEEFGHYLELTVKDEKGKVAAEADDVYEVAHHWAKLVRQTSCSNIFGPTTPEDTYDYEIEKLRKAYINEVELYNINELNSLKHPDGSKKEYDSVAAGKVIYRKLKLFIDKCHENGIKVRTYNHMPSAKLDLIPDKRAIVYGPCNVGEVPYMEKWGANRNWKDNGFIIDPNFRNLEEKHVMIDQLTHMKHFREELARSVKALDWDSIYFDGFLWNMTLPIAGKDKNGKTLTDMSPDDIGSRVLGYYYEKLKKIKDNFYIFPSINMTGSMIPPDYPSDRHKIMAWKKKIGFPKTAGLMDTWAIEIHLHYKKKAHGPSAERWPKTYQTLGPAFQGLRENANASILSIASWTQPGYFKVHHVKPMYAMLFSSGVLVWDHQKGPKNEVINPKAAQALWDYFKFAARYGEFIYGTDIRWPEQDIVQIKAPESIYWKNTYYEKKINDGKYIIIHLLNLPDEHYLWFKERNVPRPVKNALVEVEDQKGLKLVDIHYLNADKNTDPKKLSFKKNENKIIFTIPDIEYWSMAVMKFKEK